MLQNSNLRLMIIWNFTRVLLHFLFFILRNHSDLDKLNLDESV